MSFIKIFFTAIVLTMLSFGQASAADFVQTESNPQDNYISKYNIVIKLNKNEEITDDLIKNIINKVFESRFEMTVRTNEIFARYGNTIKNQLFNMKQSGRDIDNLRMNFHENDLTIFYEIPASITPTIPRVEEINACSVSVTVPDDENPSEIVPNQINYCPKVQFIENPSFNQNTTPQLDNNSHNYPNPAQNNTVILAPNTGHNNSKIFYFSIPAILLTTLYIIIRRKL